MPIKKKNMGGEGQEAKAYNTYIAPQAAYRSCHRQSGRTNITRHSSGADHERCGQAVTPTAGHGGPTFTNGRATGTP